MPQHEAKEKSDRGKGRKLIPGVPYDRGYAWVIVTAGFMILFTMAGIQRSSGIFFMAIQEKYGSSSTKTAFIYALRHLTSMVASLPARLLIERIGTRYVVILGGFVTSLGSIVSCFSDNLYSLMFSMGFLTGLGASMLYSPVLVLVCSYFKKYRSVASGLTVSGNSIGGMFFPALIYGLLEEYELQGSFLLCGGILLNICMFGMLLRPLEYFRKFAARRKDAPEDQSVKVSLGCESDQSSHKVEADVPAPAPGEDEISALERCMQDFNDCETSMPVDHDAFLSTADQRRAQLGMPPCELRCRSQVLWVSERSDVPVPRRCVSVALLLDDPKCQVVPVTASSSDDNLDHVSILQLRGDGNGRESVAEKAASLDAKSTNASELEVAKESDVPPKRRKFVTVARDLLRNRLYMTIVVCQACYSESFKTLTMCIPPHIVQIGFYKEVTIHFLLVMHLCDLAGRLSSMAISTLIQKKSRRFTKRHAYIVCVHCYSFSVITLALCDRYVPLIYLSMSLMGFASGFATANYTVVLAECCDIRIEDLGIAHSLSLCVQSFFILTLSVGLGALADIADTWKWSILTCGILTNLGCLVANSNVYQHLFRYFRKHTPSPQPPAACVDERASVAS